MKLSVVYILALCPLVFTAPTETKKRKDFSIIFYQEPHFKIQEGEIYGEVAKGGSAGTKSGNMTVGSFKTKDFLQVTLYEEKYYEGQSHVYVGSQKSISPAIHVGSVKWKYL